MGSNPFESPEFFRFMRQLLKIVQQVRGSYLHLISNTALHITFLSYSLIYVSKKLADLQKGIWSTKYRVNGPFTSGAFSVNGKSVRGV